jgi:chromosome partitioning protein
VKVVATYSIKGGVGKTTTAVNLAVEAARTGVRVLVWDLDAQGSATFFFRVRPVIKGGAAGLVRAKGELERHVRATDIPGVDLVPSDFSLRLLDLELDGRKRPERRLASLLRPLADRYDLAVLDCPPGITLTSEAVFRAADALLVPVIPTTLSARTLEGLVAFLDGDHPLVVPHFSMVDRRRKLHRQLVDELGERWSFLETPIPASSVVERMGTERAAVAPFASSTAAGRAYRQLWQELAARLWP